MTTYPLATLACTVDANGISAPSYEDILLSLQASYRAIYGEDVVLAEDTQDGQWLAILAKAQADTNAAQIFTYNEFSPATAQGAGLSSVVRINGITRQSSSFSSVVVILVGQTGTAIINGQVGDNQNLNTTWNLPDSVVIPPEGEIAVTAVCTTEGAVTAAANTIAQILTPTAGWQLVGNPDAAVPGDPVETDYELRRRQTVSTQLPAETILGGLYSRVANLPGVTQLVAYENDTDIPNDDLMPPHSICFSILGGDVQQIVDTIGAGKGPGSNTYGGITGSVSGTYTDPISGIPYTIYYNVPTTIPIGISVEITVEGGYSTAIGAEIKQALVNFINGLGIGNDVIHTRLYAPALLVGPYAAPSSPANSNTYELRNLFSAILPNPGDNADIAIAFDQIAHCVVENVTVTIV